MNGSNMDWAKLISQAANAIGKVEQGEQTPFLKPDILHAAAGTGGHGGNLPAALELGRKANEAGDWYAKLAILFR